MHLVQKSTAIDRLIQNSRTKKESAALDLKTSRKVNKT